MQGQNEEMLHAACQQFLGKTEQEIRNVALETLVRHWKRKILFNGCFFSLILLFLYISLVIFIMIFFSLFNTQEGHQRAIMGTMTVEVSFFLLDDIDIIYNANQKWMNDILKWIYYFNI